jgi:hypothetical protein
MDSGHPEAQRFRELNGTAGLEQTLHKAAEPYPEIPHLVTGGYPKGHTHTDSAKLSSC